MSGELAQAIESARCGNCAHGEPSVLEDETLTIQCLRYPPQLFVLDGEVSQCVPQMHSDSVCGEHQPASKPTRPRPTCTGLTAAWCPVHGDCTCDRLGDLDAGDCPLHSHGSTHPL